MRQRTTWRVYLMATSITASHNEHAGLTENLIASAWSHQNALLALDVH